ncbi:MAG: M1 family metallopeptidase [Melioribacteraceae bacterium]|nr:M1 family metallopeptidase [Melioribacteraceae bacterium]
MKNVIAFLFLTSLMVLAQNSSIYLPIEFQRAVKNKTRTLTGLPGESYWVNKSEYKIKAELLPDSSMIKGNCVIKYFNNSPNNLSSLVIRLYSDILKKGSVRDWYIGNIELNDGVKISELKVNGEELDLTIGTGSVQRSSTNMVIKLPEELQSGGNVEVAVKWSLLIPKIVKVRMGNYGDGEFFVAYWYPQIAVYDDIDGWDRVEYSGAVEFYNDFNDYDFEITLPDKYVVWATGELQNSEEVFKDSIINKIFDAKESDQTVNIIRAEDYNTGRVTLNNGKNIWKFKAVNVPDVSFCVSDSYCWDAASVEVEPGRRVLTSVVYEDGAVHYDKAAQYSRSTIEYLSDDLPGYPYPYQHVTTFCNKNEGGGMESPMMANNGAPQIEARHINLTFHEISHNYFPFMMGTNERKYAWMDEGWASFLPEEFVVKYVESYDPYSGRVGSYEADAGLESELPPIVLSYSNKSKYRTSAYDRPAVAYLELYKLLGKETFRKATLEYINRWKNKHPLPYDFFFTFNEVAGEDLSWFWNPWFNEYGYPDLALSLEDINDSEIKFSVIKEGNIPTRVAVTIEYNDGTTQKLYKPASVWKNGIRKISINQKIDKSVSKIWIGESIIPDIDVSNNTVVLDK